MFKNVVITILSVFLVIMFISRLNLAKQIKNRVNKKVTFLEQKNNTQIPSDVEAKVNMINVYKANATQSASVPVVNNNPEPTKSSNNYVIETSERGVELNDAFDKYQPVKANYSNEKVSSRVFSNVQEDNGLSLKGLDNMINVNAGYTY